ncbi:flagellar motor protein MotB [Limnoglobus roseus]|uniref:OmpA/MotB domain protein n=1 Tax=Limnoglobus roseus TaxID=2598579 RepID=A0A5C1ADZ5_9BACT|nr:flagellar motor protein MotB [Limnoglobus roseus]QEL15344.1 OmpA/MotB domain protein [Limnoglobus roseus]
MAAGGGGSWKVAYADFVTAMMAFFMVMWIGSQDQKTKQAVANYFVDPAGVSKRPAMPGSVTPTPAHGAVPQAESTAVGRGRSSFTESAESSRVTKVVNDGIHASGETLQYWRGEANKHREEAARSPEVVDQKRPINEVATAALAKKMRDEWSQKIPPQAKGVYQDLLFSSLADVNWTQIAEDMLQHS